MKKNQYVAVITFTNVDGRKSQAITNHPDHLTFRLKIRAIKAKHNGNVDVKVLDRQFDLMEVCDLRALAWRNQL